MDFKVYEYPIKHPDGFTYYGSYTIKADVHPLGYKGEKLVSRFSINEPVKIIGAEFEPEKMHLFEDKRKNFHPVHIIEGGDIITEDDRVLNINSDCGWYYLNDAEYKYFKSKCEEIIIEVK